MIGLRFPKPAPRRALKRSRAASHRAEMAEIRAAVVARARGRCECGCGSVSLFMEADHFWGGSGRRREAQSIETVWLLSAPCHRAKTESRPSREAWLTKWAEHCARHGLSPEAPGLRKRVGGVA